MKLRNMFLAMVPLAALSLTGCDVDVKDPGEAPDVQVDPGRAPDVDVRGPDVDVGTKETEMEVPDIDVQTEKKKVTVPDIDVDLPDENEAE